MTTTAVEETRRRRIPTDTFALRLKAVRLDAGDLTIMEAAERCGLLNQSWSNWEHGRIPHNIVEIVEAISEAFDVEFNWLLRGGALQVAPPTTRSRRRGLTSAYGLTRVIARDRPQSSDARPSTYGAKVRPGVARVGAIQRRRGAAR